MTVATSRAGAMHLHHVAMRAGQAIAAARWGADRCLLGVDRVIALVWPKRVAAARRLMAPAVLIRARWRSAATDIVRTANTWPAETVVARAWVDAMGTWVEVDTVPDMASPHTSVTVARGITDAPACRLAIMVTIAATNTIAATVIIAATNTIRRTATWLGVGRRLRWVPSVAQA